jgi:putative membrane protein
MIESFEKNKKGIVIMLFSALFVCTGQLFWKLSSTMGIVLLLLGFIFYGIGALLMIFAYRFGSVSVLQPILSANYIVSAILGKIVLNEPISVQKIVAIIIISCGVILISGGD